MAILQFSFNKKTEYIKELLFTNLLIKLGTSDIAVNLFRLQKHSTYEIYLYILAKPIFYCK